LNNFDIWKVVGLRNSCLKVTGNSKWS